VIVPGGMGYDSIVNVRTGLAIGKDKHSVARRRFGGYEILVSTVVAPLPHVLAAARALDSPA
jgi:hypothetical protein